MPVDPHPQSAELGYLTPGELSGPGSPSRRELVEALIARAEALDRPPGRPGLNCLIALDAERAATQAAAADEELAGVRQPPDDRPLLGIPVVVKDNIDTVDLGATAGSLALVGSPPVADAPVVARLRAAGAIVLGKANLSEWANIRARRSSSGWSGVGGQCKNPYALDRSPGGSSAGSAAAVAAGLAPLALGTETDGSILCPSALNGLVGLKPTLGLVPADGVVPIASSLDCVGPMTRTVDAAALLLDVLTAAGKIGTRYRAALVEGALSGARLGVVYPHSAEVPVSARAALDVALSALAEAGAVLVEAPGATIVPEETRNDELTVLLTELHHDLERYLERRPGSDGAPPRTLDALIAFNEDHREEELAIFGQELFVAAASTPGIDDPTYRLCLARMRERAGPKGIDAALAADGLDALVALTMAPAWCIDQVNGDPPVSGNYSIAAIAGYPSLTVPIGLAAGLPVGLAFLGPAHSEERLIALGYGLERQLGVSLRPSFASALPMR